MHHLEMKKDSIYRQSQTLFTVTLSKAAASMLLKPFPLGEEPEDSENM